MVAENDTYYASATYEMPRTDKPSSEDSSDDGGCCSCIVALALFFVCLGLLGLAIKFCRWAWTF